MELNIRGLLCVQGFARLPGIFSANDLEEIGRITDQLISSWNASSQDNDFWWYRQEENDILYRIHNLERKHPSIQTFLKHGTLSNLVRIALGEPAVPTACALIYKKPCVGGEVPWHHDPLDVPPCTTYNFSVFLDQSTADNGAIEFVPGSHLLQASYPTGRPENAMLVEAEPGDVVIHDVKVYHGSAKSVSQNARRSIITEFQPIRFNPTSILVDNFSFRLNS